MTLSQNNWQAFSDYGDAALVSNPTVPGTDVKVLGGLRSGDVATVLLEVARRWNNEVETLVQDLGCWGFEPRNIRGSSSVSNHASGTAIDLNSARHPLGTEPSATLSAAQIAAARRIRDDMGGVVRWGGDYSGRKDTMHWEIDAGAAQAAALAGQLTSTPTPPPIQPTPPAPTGGFLMALTDKQQAEMYDTLHDLRTNGIAQGQKTVGGTFAAILSRLQANFNQGNELKGAVVNNAAAIKGAIANAVKAGGTPDQIADAVVKELAQ